MKVEKLEKEFNPIIIKLETKEEMEIMKNISNLTDTIPKAFEKHGWLYKDKIYYFLKELFDKLKEVK